MKFVFLWLHISDITRCLFFSDSLHTVRESIPRQTDKSPVPEEEEKKEEEKCVWGSQTGDRGLEFSRRRKRPPHTHSIVLVRNI